MKEKIIKLIELYQKYVSPDHSEWGKQRYGAYCRYYPSCSEYSKEAIEKKGLIV
jgi:putative component of membrane protein insertase Oxa1/YidC/SpoIIIJ protein YidD